MHSGFRAFITGGPYAGNYAKVVSVDAASVLCRVGVMPDAPAVPVDAKHVELQRLPTHTQDHSLQSALDQVKQERSAWWWWSHRQLPEAERNKLWSQESKDLQDVLCSLKAFLPQRVQPGQDWYDLCREYLPLRPLTSAQRVQGAALMRRSLDARKHAHTYHHVPTERGERRARRHAQVLRHADAIGRARQHECIQTGHLLSADAIALWMCAQVSTEAERTLWRSYINLKLVGALGRLDGWMNPAGAPPPNVRHTSVEFCALAQDPISQCLVGCWYPAPNKTYTGLVRACLRREHLLYEQVASSLGEWFAKYMLSAFERHAYEEQDLEHARNIELIQEMFDDYTELLHHIGLDLLSPAPTSNAPRVLDTLDDLGVEAAEDYPARDLHTLGLILSAADLPYLEPYTSRALSQLQQGRPHEALALARDCWSYAEASPALRCIAQALGSRAYEALGLSVYAKQCTPAA